MIGPELEHWELKRGDGNGVVSERELAVFGNQLHECVAGKEELRLSLL